MYLFHALLYKISELVLHLHLTKPALANTILRSGFKIRLTPPVIATLISPVRKAWQAWCSATSEEEQAVSTAMLGPLAFKKYESLLAAILNALPVPAY